MINETGAVGSLELQHNHKSETKQVAVSIAPANKFCFR